MNATAAVTRETIYRVLTGPVAAALAEDGLTLALTADWQTTGDAWCDATRQHGERIAHIHLEDGHWASMRHRPWGNGEWLPVTDLRVNFPWDDADAGATILSVLLQNSIAATWTGNPEHSIRINL